MRRGNRLLQKDIKDSHAQSVNKNLGGELEFNRESFQTIELFALAKLSPPAFILEVKFARDSLSMYLS